MCTTRRSAWFVLLALLLSSTFLPAAAPPSPPLPPTWTLDLHEQAVGHLADGKGKDTLIAADGSGAVRFWNLAKGEEIRSFQAHEKGQGLDALAVSPDGNYLATGDSRQQIRVWEMDRPKMVHDFDHGLHSGSYSLVFQADGKRLFAAPTSQEGVSDVVVYDLVKGKLERRHQWPNRGVWSTMYDRGDGSLILGGHDQQDECEWMIMDAKTGKITRRTALPKVDMSALALSPNKRTLLTADNSEEAIINLWDSRTGKRQRTVETGLREIFTVAFSPDGRYVVATCPGVTKPPGIASVKVWDTKTWKPVWSHRVKEGHRPTIAHFTRDGKWLAVGLSILSGNSGAVLVWDWKRLRRSFAINPVDD